jgi:hypothetical protein
MTICGLKDRTVKPRDAVTDCPHGAILRLAEYDITRATFPNTNLVGRSGASASASYLSVHYRKWFVPMQKRHSESVRGRAERASPGE